MVTNFYEVRIIWWRIFHSDYKTIQRKVYFLIKSCQHFLCALHFGYIELLMKCLCSAQKIFGSHRKHRRISDLLLIQSLLGREYRPLKVRQCQVLCIIDNCQGRRSCRLARRLHDLSSMPRRPTGCNIKSIFNLAWAFLQSLIILSMFISVNNKRTFSFRTNPEYKKWLRTNTGKNLLRNA